MGLIDTRCHDFNFALPKLLSVAGNCRLTLRLLAHPCQYNVISPTPVRASPSATMSPPCPRPLTYACRFSNLLNCAARLLFGCPQTALVLGASARHIRRSSRLSLSWFMLIWSGLYSICFGIGYLQPTVVQRILPQLLGEQ